MRTIKKIGAWMLIVCILVAQVVPVHATEEYTNPTLIVSNAVAEAGTQVQVTIEMVNNPGIINMALNVEYDDTVLSLVSTDLDGDYCPDGVVDGGILGSYLHSDNAAMNPYYLYWANDTASNNYTTDGLLVTLVFDVASNARAGEYPIEIFYGDYEIFNYDLEPVDFDLVNGAVTIPAKSNFVDIAPGAYYEIPVQWAVENGITSGVDETHFAPDAPCTRAQIVTFLWGAAGSPEPVSMNSPFVDVTAGSYYYKPVLWAVENGITSGNDATHFAPDTPCSRGQVVTFLWSFRGRPAPSGNNIFTDVAPDAYYYKPVLWAVENGITSGMGDNIFGPDFTCNRAQIVTFLYKAVG